MQSTSKQRASSFAPVAIHSLGPLIRTTATNSIEWEKKRRFSFDTPCPSFGSIVITINTIRPVCLSVYLSLSTLSFSPSSLPSLGLPPPRPLSFFLLFVVYICLSTLVLPSLLPLCFYPLLPSFCIACTRGTVRLLLLLLLRSAAAASFFSLPIHFFLFIVLHNACLPLSAFVPSAKTHGSRHATCSFLSYCLLFLFISFIHSFFKTNSFMRGHTRHVIALGQVHTAWKIRQKRRKKKSAHPLECLSISAS